jgi:hypothetical protein
MKEDYLTNYLIEYHRENYDIQEIVPEKHYNYYGDRGIVDLFVRYKNDKDHIFEIKSNPKNANEVLRQFNRMKKYFYKGTDLERRNSTFELCFTPTAKNLRHFKENKEMYREVEGFVSMRAPGNANPIILAGGENGEKSNLSNYREVNKRVVNFIISTADMVEGKISLEISDI